MKKRQQRGGFIFQTLVVLLLLGILLFVALPMLVGVGVLIL